MQTRVLHREAKQRGVTDSRTRIIRIAFKWEMKMTRWIETHQEDKIGGIYIV